MSVNAALLASSVSEELSVAMKGLVRDNREQSNTAL